MSLIFEGLKRNGNRQKQSSQVILQTESSEEDLDVTTATASLLSDQMQFLKKTESYSTAVDCFPKNNPHRQRDQIQIIRSKKSDITNTNKFPPVQVHSPKKSNQSTELQTSPSAARIEQLRNGLQRPRFIFKPQNPANINTTSTSKNKLTNGLIILESLITAPYKLLKFLCGTPLQSINFCSNWTVLLLVKLWESICTSVGIIANIFSKLARLYYSTLLRLPVLGLTLIGSFLKRQCSFFYDCMRIGVDKLREKAKVGLTLISGIFFSLIHCYRTAINKILSISLPNHWIQNAMVFLMKSSAITISCCFVVMVIKNVICPDILQNTKDSIGTAVALQGKTMPRRKLKHLFRDPLIVKQKQVRNALLAMHVDTIQRYEQGNERIIIDDKIYGLGSIMNEHPRIWLEKIGKNNLYFSDKYGQYYKRALIDMME
ncbi:MAG: hypothetical protein LBH08_02905 [Puniceicoccales bacterium]|jgi:hypothetical protein|nr:hypothetical protein [Puniceicoccales bacterium]